MNEGKIIYKMHLSTHLPLINAAANKYIKYWTKVSIKDKKWVNFIHITKVFLFPAKQVIKGQG